MAECGSRKESSLTDRRESRAGGGRVEEKIWCSLHGCSLNKETVRVSIRTITETRPRPRSPSHIVFATKA